MAFMNQAVEGNKKQNNYMVKLTKWSGGRGEKHMPNDGSFSAKRTMQSYICI